MDADIVIPAADTKNYVVRCPPNGPYDEHWFTGCIGVKIADEPDGSWRVRRYGAVADLRECVFPIRDIHH